MQNTLLLKMWQALPDTQQQQILKGARSPLFNQRPEVLSLIELIAQNNRKSHAGASGLQKTGKSALSKKAAFQYVYAQKSKHKTQGNLEYDDNKMRRLLSYALELCRKCIAYDSWDKDDASRNLYVCRSLKKAGLDFLFEKELQRAQYALEVGTHRSDTYFYEKLQLEQEAWEVIRQSKRNDTGSIQTLNTSFANFVAINSLRQGCILLAQKAMVNVTATIPYLQETLRLAETGVFQGIPAVAAWHASYLSLVELDNDVHFKRLVLHIKQDAEVFPLADLRDLYILAINVCIRRINVSDNQYVREAFDLYKGGLSSKIFLENGFLSKFTYRNILKSALGVGEWEWAFQYLVTFKEFLPTNERENFFQYNLATYYFRKNDYEKAQELLRHVELQDMLENFDARRMLLRIYFERKEWDALSYLLDSFSIYLQRHKEGGYHRDSYRNLVRFAKKIMALPGRSKIQRQKIAEMIQRTEYLAEREWLLSIL